MWAYRDFRLDVPEVVLVLIIKLDLESRDENMQTSSDGRTQLEFLSHQRPNDFVEFGQREKDNEHLYEYKPKQEILTCISFGVLCWGRWPHLCFKECWGQGVYLLNLAKVYMKW